MLGRRCLYDPCYLSAPHLGRNYLHRLEIHSQWGRLAIWDIITGLLVVGLSKGCGVAKNSWLIRLAVIHLQIATLVNIRLVHPHLLTVHR